MYRAHRHRKQPLEIQMSDESASDLRCKTSLCDVDMEPARREVWFLVKSSMDQQRMMKRYLVIIHLVLDAFSKKRVVCGFKCLYQSEIPGSDTILAQHMKYQDQTEGDEAPSFYGQAQEGKRARHVVSQH